MRDKINIVDILSSFVTTGKTIGTDVLRRKLSEILDTSLHEYVCLFVQMRGGVFKSLITIHHRDNEVGQQLTQKLRNVQSVRPSVPSAFDHHKTAASPSSHLASLGIEPSTILKDGPQASFLHTIKGDGVFRAHIHLLFVGTADTMQSISPRDVLEIESLVHCTVFVANKREQVIDEDLDKGETRAERHITQTTQSVANPNNKHSWRETRFGIYAQKTLDIALPLTRSDYSAMLTLARNFPGLDSEMIEVKTTHELTRSQIKAIRENAEEVYHKRRPAIKHLEHAGYTLAFPVVRKRKDDAVREVQYVLVVVRLSTSHHPFEHRDLVILRTVGARLLRYRDQLRHETSEHLLTGFSDKLSRNAQSERSDRAEGNLLGEEHLMLTNEEHRGGRKGQENLFAFDNVTDVLPCELSELHEQITAAVVGLYELTPSRSISVRMLSTSEQTLIRCCSIWDRPVNAQPGYILNVKNESSMSANAWCVQWGRSVNIGNIDNKIAWRSQHPYLREVLKARGQHDTLRSLYCVPIRSSNRIIGTVNVESVYVNAFGFSISLVDAVAAHIGRTVEIARERNEALLNVSSGIGELMHETVHIKPMADEVRATNPTDHKIIALLSQVSRLTGAIRDVRQDDFGTTSSNIDMIVQAAIAKTQLLIATVFVPNECGRLFLPGDAILLERCIVELLQNARRHTRSEWDVRLVVSRVNRGRQTWIKLSVANSRKYLRSEYLSMDSISRMGRALIWRDGQHHWGLLMVGAALRQRFGGTVYVDELTDNDIMVSMEIPDADQTDSQRRSK